MIWAARRPLPKSREAVCNLLTSGARSARLPDAAAPGLRLGDEAHPVLRAGAVRSGLSRSGRQAPPGEFVPTNIFRRQMMRRFFGKLYIQVLIGVIAGVALGMYSPEPRGRREATRRRVHPTNQNGVRADHLCDGGAGHCPHGEHEGTGPRRCPGADLFRSAVDVCARSGPARGQPRRAWRGHERGSRPRSTPRRSPLTRPPPRSPPASSTFC